METITVKDVEKNAQGWYEITLEDGRVPATKNQTMADAAFASRGTETEAEINTVVNGKFTNLYLNKFGDLVDEKPKASNGARRAGGGRSPKEQNDIAKQWAVGRAVELLIASNVDYSFPLDAKTLSDLATQAQDIFKTRDLLK